VSKLWCVEAIAIAAGSAYTTFSEWRNVYQLAKAGFSGWLSLLMVIPVVNLITLYIFAFSAWPSLQEKDK